MCCTAPPYYLPTMRISVSLTLIYLVEESLSSGSAARLSRAWYYVILHVPTKQMFILFGAIIHGRGRASAARSLYARRVAVYPIREPFLSWAATQKRAIDQAAYDPPHTQRGQRGLPGTVPAAEEAQRPLYREYSGCELRWGLRVSGDGGGAWRDAASTP